eukprot:9017248-Alexandrium_andersonii.AAC.1
MGGFRNARSSVGWLSAFILPQCLRARVLHASHVRGLCCSGFASGCSGNRVIGFPGSGLAMSASRRVVSALHGMLCWRGRGRPVRGPGTPGFRKPRVGLERGALGWGAEL